MTIGTIGVMSENRKRMKVGIDKEHPMTNPMVRLPKVKLEVRALKSKGVMNVLPMLSKSIPIKGEPGIAM